MITGTMNGPALTEEGVGKVAADIAVIITALAGAVTDPGVALAGAVTDPGVALAGAVMDPGVNLAGAVMDPGVNLAGTVMYPGVNLAGIILKTKPPTITLLPWPTGLREQASLTGLIPDLFGRFFEKSDCSYC